MNTEELTTDLGKKIKELSKELRKKRASCKRYCPVWNTEDGDCEIFGSYTTPPSRCSIYLAQHVERR